MSTMNETPPTPTGYVCHLELYVENARSHEHAARQAQQMIETPESYVWRVTPVRDSTYRHDEARDVDMDELTDEDEERPCTH